ncbi:MAG TPA: DUF3618 domain-containing protein, partial [Acetobacteraceae bacterium]|nr:DUF3618 domain-containing protein [Acetobacteraceae bacterium]
MNRREPGASLVPYSANGPTRLSEIERNISDTRAALEQTLDELSERLLPAERLVTTGMDIAGGSIGQASLNRCLQFVRAHPVPAAVIGCGIVLAVLGTSDDPGASAPAVTEWKRLRIGAPSVFGEKRVSDTGETGPKATLPGTQIVIALGLVAGLVAAVLMMRKGKGAAPRHSGERPSEKARGSETQ